MSLLTEEELINILPKDGPKVKETIKYLDKYNEDFIVIKMGGSVFSNKILFNNVIEDIYKKGKQTILLAIINKNNQRRYLGVKTN